MLFPTVDFAVFFSVVLACSYLLPPFGAAWKVFILLASYVFYGWWDWRFVGLIVASTLLNWGCGEAIARSRQARIRRLWLASAVVADLGILGLFKYCGFFLSSLDNVLHAMHLGAGVPVLQVVLPIGISFFTFQGISYIVDVYRGTTETARFLDFAVYLAFFPHVIAGPIVRARELIPQLRRSGYERRIDATRALFLIVGGLFKKVVLASFLASNLVDPVFAVPQAHSALEVLVALYGYAVQIYADFSGYTDIAIGCALLLGIRFPDNFAAPYTAVSLQDFWHRWHITLSRWLRDYLYIPLGGSRGTPLRTYRNLLVTFVLGGLWHGAAWTFVVWGAIHGVGLSLERLAREHLGQRRWAAQVEGAPWVPALRRLLTFHVVCLAWLFFRADSLGTAWALLGRLVSARGPAPLVTVPVLVAISAGIAMQYVPRDVVARLQAATSRLAPALQGAAAAASLVVIGALGPQGVAPFIYFRF